MLKRSSWRSWDVDSEDGSSVYFTTCWFFAAVGNAFVFLAPSLWSISAIRDNNPYHGHGRDGLGKCPLCYARLRTWKGFMKHSQYSICHSSQADGLTVPLMCPAEHKAGVFLCRGSSLMDSERTRDHPSQSLISCYSHWQKAPWRVDTGSIQHGCSSLSSWPIFLWQTLVAQSFFSMGPPRRGWCSVYKGCFEVKAALLSFWILFIKAKCPFCLSAGLHYTDFKTV